jgi:putative ABC transport system permease protein
LALVLLIGAGLMIQSFLRLQRVNPGFNSDQVLTMQLSLPPALYPPPQRDAFFRRLIERCKTFPSVLAVAAGKHLPLTGDNMNFAFDVDGRPFPPGKSPGADCRFVTPEYFRALAIPLVKGRTFDESDGADAPHVLVINEAAARRFFPNEDPIGKRVRLGINNFRGEIVGVVGDVKHRGLDAEVREEVYTAYSQATFWTEMTLVVRSSADPMSLAGPLRNEIRNLDKQVSISKVRSLRTILVDSVAQPRFRTLLLALFGAAALMLASVGIYGVMSYAVTQRTREIGVRMAVGARASDVLKLVVTQGMKLAVIGVVIGLVAAIALTRLMNSLLFGIGATDPLTFIAVALLLTLVALFACWIPARRATKVDPILALRCE